MISYEIIFLFERPLFKMSIDEVKKLEKQVSALWELLSYVPDDQIANLIELRGEDWVKEVFDDEYADWKKEQEEEEEQNNNNNESDDDDDSSDSDDVVVRDERHLKIPTDADGCFDKDFLQKKYDEIIDITKRQKEFYDEYGIYGCYIRKSFMYSLNKPYWNFKTYPLQICFDPTEYDEKDCVYIFDDDDDDTDDDSSDSE